MFWYYGVGLGGGRREGGRGGMEDGDEEVSVALGSVGEGEMWLVDDLGFEALCVGVLL